MSDEADPKDDIANRDPFSGAGGYAVPKKINVTYTVVFDDEQSLKDYYHYIRLLKKRYPDTRTIGGRIVRHIREEQLPPLEAKYGKPAKKSVNPVGHETRAEVEIIPPE